MKKLSFDEVFARELYHNHCNDKKIAKAVGKTPNTIAQWRRRKKLPANIGNIANGTYVTGANYCDVLEPGQVDAMSTFLVHLLKAGKQAVRAGVKPDVMGFMDVYAGRTKMWTEERRERVTR